MNAKSVRLVLLISVLISLLSCVKRPEESNTEPEIPLDYGTLYTSVSDGFGAQSMSDMKTGEFTNQMTTVQIADYPAQVLQQKAQQILCYDKVKDEYKIVETLETYSQDGKSSKSSTEHNFTLLNPKLQTSWTSSLLLIFLCDGTQPFNKAANVICSELKVEDFTASPPIEVKNSTNCGGLNPCQLDYRRISYYRSADIVDGTGTKIRNKVLVSALLAKNAPFLSRVIEFCQQGIVDIDEKTSIYAKLCEKTRYFTAGDSNQLLCSP